MSIATIILAAGGSTRLGGHSKQMLIQNGTTLVQRITQIALSLQVGPVIVVIGANQESIQAEINHLPIQLAVNSNWQEGLASSLRVGLTHVSEESVDAFLIVLTDQPHISPELLRDLIHTQQQTGRGIVACQYGEPGHVGVPALFSMQYKPTFMNLSGDVGARKLIQQHTNDCAELSFPLAAIDLDTWQDVKQWQQN